MEQPYHLGCKFDTIVCVKCLIYKYCLDRNKDRKEKDMEVSRPTWNEYFATIAKTVATRSTCLRRNVGAVIVRNKQILSTGYNGTPVGEKHCKVCERQRLGIASGERYELCNSVHAEANAIIQAAKHGISIDGADMYVTDEPCFMCRRMIVNAGIRVVYINGEPWNHSRE